ncbi:MAG: type II secretion system protein [Verrucomicrobia bacterium]|nr:type II secretion system protein [Verrucomicrobiota bacterium]
MNAISSSKLANSKTHQRPLDRPAWQAHLDSASEIESAVGARMPTSARRVQLQRNRADVGIRAPMAVSRCAPALAAAFTLIELLVVVAIIAILASLLLPVLGKAKAKGQSIKCISNLKQLQLAWQMYHEDNEDKLARNELPGWMGGSTRLLPGSWAVGNPGTDTSASNIQQGVLFPYVRSPAVYRCPADKSTVGDRKDGLLRMRNYSMSCYMNGKNPESQLITPPYSQYDWVVHRASQIVAPPPSQAFVFIQEHPGSSLLSGGWFYLPLRWATLSVPFNHENGENLSFADGHAEHWRWRDPNTARHVELVGNRDLARRLQATPAWWAAAAMRPGTVPDQGGPNVFP